jgi:putative transposase
MQSGRSSAAGAKGRKPAWPLREIIGHLLCLPGRIPWRLIPKVQPPNSTVFGYLCRWRDASVFTRINHCLVMADRERTGRQASQNAPVLDSQSVKTTEGGCRHGYAAGEEILMQGRKERDSVAKKIDAVKRLIDAKTSHETARRLGLGCSTDYGEMRQLGISRPCVESMQ